MGGPLDQAWTQQMAGEARLAHETRTRFPGGMFAVSLLLLGTSYVLLLSAPLVSERLRVLAGEARWQSLAHWVPAASGAGLALGGAAALLGVLAKLSKDIRRHPYACVAPALAAFAACVMIGLDAKLPLGRSEPLCVFALALSVMGGSLVQESRAAAQLFGWSLTVVPSVSLVAAVWAASGRAQLSQAIWSLTPESRLFLAMLALSSVSMALLGMVARVLSASHEARRLATLSPSPRHAAASHAHPFSAREDTLDLDLRSAEHALRRRPLARPALFAAACVMFGIVAGLWYRGNAGPAEAARRSKSARAATIIATPMASDLVQAATVPEPKVEPWQPPSAALAPSEPEPALPEPPVFAAELSAQPAAAAAAEPEPSPQERADRAVDVEPDAPVVTLRATPARKVKPTRARQPKVASRVRAAKTTLPVEPAPVKGSAAKVVQGESIEAERTARGPEAPKVEEEGASARVDHPVKPEKEAKPSPAAAVSVAPTKKEAAPSRADESLDELMDRVVENKRGKPNVSADDPIFGL